MPVGTPILVATQSPLSPIDTATPGGKSIDLNLKSEAFMEGMFIPKKFTGDSMDVSPALSWNKPPIGTRSFAIICDDSDATAGVWTHWVIFNIKSDTTSLPENVPKLLQIMGTVKQGANSFGRIGYYGPKPPPGSPHRYLFKIYALDKELALPAASRKVEIEKAMEGHILARGQLMGQYKR
ncbi:MAG: YbhB/YbcL family Raf kinase inhibitor-like protein [Candidatus Eremiobacteraeota bacterium]|nr:YbhB/YbcL family Raf kinase inhibitor-like protein [Candidatus Eremiobacteraeota bacterium]